ncbi:sphingoid long-chain base transporter RSB1 [Verticillium alfalfae VaMs.102]|uniref:Sphingoid long-chain base transporter RSB1 n=1 Tax=Verticillium alfalfae (strain VaMs.102 / ATCC MYA-4576 / FGSC 10136) TaxID=526221 RepID=C9SAX3_VERA1|nr:sphingoid long-chain base transporter RSB1 [Verticillium alfalfae VaMs.102]EEY15547.1 sphingoid long-chain base transporter RSB1 [Verticillium alfalfae VaMs.102]
MSAPTGSETWSDRDWFDWCYNNSDSLECEDMDSYYEYRLSIGANATMLALFSLSALAYITTYAVTRRGLSFFIAMILGVACEILGYAGRVVSWQNRWDENGFLIQICCLTIGPAFLAAGIYLCLRRIVYAYGAANSRIKPEWYTPHRKPCSPRPATYSWLTRTPLPVHPVVTMLIFMLVTADFALNTLRRSRRLGAAAALDQDPTLSAVRASRLFRAFLAALTLSFVCIFIRCVFRVAELSGGWTGPLMRRQDLFIAFESAMIATAVLLLNVLHPALACAPLLEGVGGLHICGRRGDREKKGAQPGGAARRGFRHWGKSEASSTSDGV